MPDYNKCCIYKLCCKNPEIEEFYIGSTTNITKRKHDHKKCCINPKDKEYNHYKYQFIRDNGGWDNFTLIPIHDFSCNSKLEQHKIEREYIERLKPALNKTIPARHQTGDIYDRNEYNRGYYKDNKERFRLKQCQIIKCICGRELTVHHIARHTRTKQHQEYISSSSGEENNNTIAII